MSFRVSDLVAQGIIQGDSAYANIFYDSANTAYYLDPAGTSVLNGLTVGGSSVVTNNGGTWGISISGNAATVTNGVYTTGSYANPAWITSLAWSKITGAPAFITGNQTITLSGDATGSGTTAITVTLANSGVTAATYGGNNSIPSLVVDSKGRITSASTVTPSGTWGINVTGTAGSETLATVTGRGASTSSDLTFNGTLTMGTGGTQYIRMGRFPASVTNTGEAWIGRASDRNSGTMTVQLGGNSASGRQFEVVDYAWSVVLFNVSSGGDVTASNSMRAPIFYDSANTGYYLDPAGTSRLGGGTDSNVIEMVNGNWGAWFMIGGWTTDTTHARLRVSNGNIHMDSKGGGYDIYLNWYTNRPVYFGGDQQVSGTIYDYSNASYYLKPSSTSNLNALKTASYEGNANVGGTGNAAWFPSGLYSGSTQWLYGTMYRNGSNTYHSGGALYDVSNLTGNANSASFYPNNGSYGSWRIGGTKNGWYGLNFDSGNTLMMNSNESGHHQEGYGWKWRWYGGYLYTSRSTYGGGTEYTVLDSGNYNSWAAAVNGNVSNTFNVFQLSYASTDFNPSAAPRTTMSSMSVKMWNNYFNGTGLGSDYGTVMQYYSLGSHVDSQVYFDARGGSWYRTASYNSGWQSWQKYVTENGGTWGINITGSAGSVEFNNLTSKTGGTGTYQTSGDFRAPIFYDSNDTTYYLDPASTGTSLNVAGNITVGVGRNDSSIIMGDSDQGNRSIHCNSDRIGFLTQGGSWGAYLDDADNWYGVSSVRAPIFYDSQDTNYYGDFAGTSKLNTVDTFQVRNIYGVSTDHQFGIFFGNADGTAYAIYRESGTWTNPYPDLRISFHTGIKLGANANYNGIRFYDDYTMVNQVMSVNNGSDGLGANNVYVNNSLQAGSSLHAPIFYDSNDTTYYADFNNTGRSMYTAGYLQSSGMIMKGSIFAGGGGGQIYPTMSNGGVSLYGGNNLTNGAYFTVTGIDYGSSPGAGSAEFVIRSAATSKFAMFSYNGSTWTGRYSLWGSSGNVTIGDANTDYGYRLYVIGDIYATGNITSASDAKLKTNIREIENPLDRVLKSRGVVYDRVDGTDKNAIGFIAQEIEEQFPELVSTDSQGTKGVKYQNMVAVLLEAVKEQQKQINKLQSLINK